jgi:hypothetical protein
LLPFRLLLLLLCLLPLPLPGFFFFRHGRLARSSYNSKGAHERLAGSSALPRAIRIEYGVDRRCGTLKRREAEWWVRRVTGRENSSLRALRAT